MKWWPHVMFMELRKILAYRFDFWVTFLGQILIQLVIARALWQSIFESQNATEMNGYTLEMMTLYYLIVPIGTRMLTGENIGFLAREIYEGTFTRYLIYPLSFLQYKSLTYLTYSLFYGFQLIVIYSLYRLTLGASPMTFAEVQNLFLGVGIFLVAALSFVMLAIFIELISLWAENIWSLMVMLRFIVSFLGGGFIPLSFFPSWAQETLMYTPFPYFVSLPIKTIMGQTTTEEILTGIVLLLIWGIVGLGCVKLLWKRGQLSYTGVGI